MPPILIYGPSYAVPSEIRSTNDLNKGTRIRNRLIEDGIVKPESFIDPGMITLEELAEVHTPEYVKALDQDPTRFFTLSGLELLISPSVEEVVKIFDPHPYFYGRVNGTRIAALLAWEHRTTAINLGGGHHHAGVVSGKDMYGGYCVLADIPVAIHHVRMSHPEIKNVLIIDCDQHCGDGTMFTFENDPTVFTFSIHANQYYRPRLKRENLDVVTGRNPGTRKYLQLLKEGLKEVWGRFTPDMVFYIAGADPYSHDLGGGMGVSKEGMLERDRMVLESVKSRNLPLVVTLGGGYGPEAWEIHYQFICESQDLILQGLSG